MSSIRAYLIDVISPDISKRDAARRLMELRSLLDTYGGVTVVSAVQRRTVPDYRTYVGSGKLLEIREEMQAKSCDLLIINNALKPGQMFQVSEILRPIQATAWDRLDLILKIFQKHASTVEAKLEIQLAAIKHMGPRIFGMGMEMMQQSGGIGGRGGQGESNTEMMKRHLFTQEQSIKKQLEKAKQTRKTHRDRRRRIGFKTISIVGYTNAGKSSLLNALTRKGAYVANALFATLDTRVAKLWLPSIRKEILCSDTIGFIQDLPPELIEAFRSTLEETIEADLLLHVVDVADPFRAEKIQEVEEILKGLGLEEVPRVYVFNKIDQSKRIPRATILKKYKSFTPVFVSAKSGEGLEELKTRIANRIG